MKNWMFAVAMLLAAPCALADVPSDASLQKLLEVTQAKKMIEGVSQQVMGSMKPMFDQAIEAEKLDAAERERAEQFMAAASVKLEKFLAEELSWERMSEFQMQVYREAFNQQEIDDLIKFYESDTGKAFVQKMPVVMQKTMALMQQRMGPMMQRMQAAMAETANEFKAQQEADAEKAPAESDEE